jgi:hypothetical protein
MADKANHALILNLPEGGNVVPLPKRTQREGAALLR